MIEFILASGSASRRALLENSGVPFQVDPAKVDEDVLKQGFTGTPGELALYLAEAKALEVSTRRAGLVLGADQVLEFNGAAYDKAKSVDEARERLAMLRGSDHFLQGGIVLAENGKTVWSHSASSRLRIRNFSDDFLDHYIAHAGDILTKGVGAYAFEGIGAQLFEAVDGDFFAILGLDLLPVLDQLRQRGVISA